MVDDGNDRSQDGPLDRTIAILTFVCEQRKALSAAEIAAAHSLPLPTAHRLICNLESRGLIQKALGTKRYVVGDKLVTLSAKAIGSAFRTARQHAVLSAVADRIGEQCEIGVVRDNGVVYVHSVRSRQPQALQFDPGDGEQGRPQRPPASFRREPRCVCIMGGDLSRYYDVAAGP